MTSHSAGALTPMASHPRPSAKSLPSSAAAGFTPARSERTDQRCVGATTIVVSHRRLKARGSPLSRPAGGTPAPSPSRAPCNAGEITKVASHRRQALENSSQSAPVKTTPAPFDRTDPPNAGVGVDLIAASHCLLPTKVLRPLAATVAETIPVRFARTALRYAGGIIDMANPRRRKAKGSPHSALETGIPVHFERMAPLYVGAIIGRASPPHLVRKLLPPSAADMITHAESHRKV